MNFIKKHLKNERGLTLIELLAVVVILGIIAAIAIPSIGGLINNSKKDAHIANAQQMVGGARTAVAGNDSIVVFGEDNTEKITMEELEEKGYLEDVDNPSGDEYDKDKSLVTVTRTTTGTFTYKVTLIGPSDKKYIIESKKDAGIPDAKDLKRDNISL